MPIGSQDFRNALGRFASGVTVVTCLDHRGAPHGLTVSAFSSVSLDPPLVLFCLDRRSTMTELVSEGRCFAVNLLSDIQEHVSRQFASRAEDRFAGIAHDAGIDGVPRLAESLATLECRVRTVYDGGDHHIVVGLVEQATVSEASPLLHFRGKYGRFSPLA